MKRNTNVLAQVYPIAGMSQVNSKAAGVDIGAQEIAVCVGEGGSKQWVKIFGTYTVDLKAIGRWLTEWGIESVAMESTGVYWIPLFEELEQQGFHCHLISSRLLRRVPGRKSDVLDCQWIQTLHSYGLLESSDRVLVIQPDENNDTTYANELLEDDIDNEIEDFVEEATAITFSLERDLQSALREKIEQLESGLRVIDGGKERITEAGRIDITAMDKDENTVIIELKAGVAQPEAITQLLAYMRAIFASDKKPVRGILIAGDFHKKSGICFACNTKFEAKEIFVLVYF